jgi:hypothetical protein
MSDEPEQVYRIIEGNNDAMPAIDAVIAEARQRLWLFDHVLKERGYNSPARFEALRAFLLGDRRREVRIALHDPDGFEGHYPRLTLLLKQFSANVKVHRTIGVAREAHDAFLIADDAHFWRKPHYQHPRSVLTLHSPGDAKPLIDRFEEIWESSEPAVSAETTGL